MNNHFFGSSFGICFVVFDNSVTQNPYCSFTSSMSGENFPLKAACACRRKLDSVLAPTQSK
jgi:hypothetical protein